MQWLLLVIFASWFVMRYASRAAGQVPPVLADIAYDDEFSQMKSGNLAFSGKQKLTMLVFFGTFLLMIYAVVPWSDLGIDLLPTLGWWFDELSTLFFSASILIALINRMPESNYVATFLNGARDLIGVALVVAVARHLCGDGAWGHHRHHTALGRGAGERAVVVGVHPDGLSGAHHPELLHPLHLGAGDRLHAADGAAGGLLRHLPIW